jgi:hypothetical protein
VGEVSPSLQPALRAVFRYPLLGAPLDGVVASVNLRLRGHPRRVVDKTQELMALQVLEFALGATGVVR